MSRRFMQNQHLHVEAFSSLKQEGKADRMQRLLVEARDELVQFKYHVSHDLGAPIASIHSLVELIAEDVQEQRYGELAEIVTETKQQLKRLDSLIADLMSLARVEAADEPYVDVDLRSLVDEVVDSISLHSRELEVSVTLAFDTPTIRTDRVRLRQILANLISNARKFSDPEEMAPSIDVQVRRETSSQVLTVTDNGVGMSEKVAAQAFSMFSRGSSRHPGHGLGLYIAQKHVDRLGGSIRVAHTAKPTVFEVTLPAPG